MYLLVAHGGLVPPLMLGPTCKNSEFKPCRGGGPDPDAEAVKQAGCPTDGGLDPAP
jgi:hypothetical protein